MDSSPAVIPKTISRCPKQSCELLAEAAALLVNTGASWRAAAVGGSSRARDKDRDVVQSGSHAQIALSTAGGQHVLTMLMEPSDQVRGMCSFSSSSVNQT